MNKIIVITGQTATGKTKLALKLAQSHNGELINCDSRQIYKHLNIITGKDFDNSKFELVKTINDYDIGFFSLSHKRIWLYDIIDPRQYFSSYDYKECALLVINDIIKRKKTPIIVGGTYFYLKHLLYGIETDDIPPNWQLRQELDNKSVKDLQDILKNLSLQIFNKLNQSDRNNPQRIIRKIEIFKSKISFQKNSNTKQSPSAKWKVKIIGLKFNDKQILHKIIKDRVEERLKGGAIDEVKNLLKIGYCEKDPGLKTIGYQQIIQYLKGNISKQLATDQWFFKEIQYAKRQYTFMKKDKNIKWQDI